MVYEFDVFTSAHDSVKVGVIREQRTRVLLSEEYTYAEAVDLAACMAVAVHGGMPTEVMPRI